MNEQISRVFKKSKLFKNIDVVDYKDILCCLNASTRNFKKNELIYNYNIIIKRVGIIVKGSVDLVIIQNDGNKYLLNRLEKGSLVGQIYLVKNNEERNFQYFCFEDADIIFFDLPRTCTQKRSCNHPQKHMIMENMMDIIIDDNIYLSKKIYIHSQKKLRNKLLAYLNILDNNVKNNSWISFNREELANFIASERSSVSRELMNMKKDDLIEIKGNKIKLI